MVLKVYGNYLSPTTQRVLLVCKELNIPYELKMLDYAKGEHRTDEFAAQFQPFRQMPVVDDDGFKLFESRAICRYLSMKYGGGAFMPPAQELQSNALFEQAVSIETNNFDLFAAPLVYERHFKLMMGEQPDEAKSAYLLKKLNDSLASYEIMLSKQKYLAGDEVTLAELFHLPYGALVFETLKLDMLADKPHVGRWWKDISSRPAWKAVKALK